MCLYSWHYSKWNKSWIDFFNQIKFNLNEVLATLVGSLWLSPQSTLHSTSSVSEKKHFYGLSHPLLVTHWPCLHPCSMYNRVPMIRKFFVPNWKKVSMLLKHCSWYQIDSSEFWKYVPFFFQKMCLFVLIRNFMFPTVQKLM